MVKLGIFVISALWGILCLLTPVQAENIPPLSETGGEVQQQLQPLKTYFLNILPGEARRYVNFSPPALKIVVFSQLGATAVRCGYSTHHYTCVPGDPQEINGNQENPIEQFWVENPHTQNMRLRINVYEAFDANPEEEEVELVPPDGELGELGKLRELREKIMGIE